MVIRKPESLTVMNDAVLTLGADGDDHAAVCQSIQITTTGGSKFVGLKKGAIWKYGKEYQLVVDFAHDYDDPESLWRFFWDHDGETVPFTMEPRDGGTGFTGMVAIDAAGVGAGARAVASSSVTLDCAERPTLVPAPTTPAP